MKLIDCFVMELPDNAATNPTREELERQQEVGHVWGVPELYSTAALRQVAEKAEAPYTLLYTKTTPLQMGMFALERWLRIAEDSQALWS